MHRLMSMNTKGTSGYLYPRIYSLVCIFFKGEKEVIRKCLFFSIIWMRIEFHHQWSDVYMNILLMRERMLLVRERDTLMNTMQSYIRPFFPSREWSCNVHLARQSDWSNVCAIFIWCSVRPIASRESKKGKTNCWSLWIWYFSVVCWSLIIRYRQMFAFYWIPFEMNEIPIWIYRLSNSIIPSKSFFEITLWKTKALRVEHLRLIFSFISTVKYEIYFSENAVKRILLFWFYLNVGYCIFYIT